MSSRPIIGYDLDEMSKLSLEKIPCELHKKREPNAIKNIGPNINQLHETKIRTISSATPLYDINQIDKMARAAAISTSIPPFESEKKESNGKSGANFTRNAQGGEPKARSMELTSKSYMHYPPNGHKLMEPVLKISSTDNHNQRTGSNSEAMAVTIVTTASTAAINTKMGEAKISDFINLYGQAGSNASSVDSLDGSNAPLKPHTGGDGRWDAIQLVNARDPPIGLTHFRLLKRLGYGDIGSVYLVELRGTETFFAMKVMDKASLAGRNKLLRAQTEREILGLLDHPFLPTLYSHFETEKFYCLVMEFCSGGNLHSLRQKQPNKHFTEQAARFYASEVLLALEYLHMLGIVYRDLKPENVLVREEGHIMLSDFDLSLRCNVNPTLVKSSSVHVSSGSNALLENEYMVHGCIQPPAFFSRILPKKARKSKSDFGLLAGGTLPELMAEPTNARSMSFVGTHEYLAPEIIRGEGHGSAVDWWTFGIFLYELLHGTTPFKGSGNHATLFNVVGQPLKFPEIPGVSLMARDLIRGLLVKDPQKRIAYRRGATEIKQHPFFEGVNWALIRSTTPPHVPDPIDYGQFASKDAASVEKKVGASKAGGSKTNSHDSSSGHLDFEYF